MNVLQSNAFYYASTSTIYGHPMKEEKCLRWLERGGGTGRWMKSVDLSSALALKETWSHETEQQTVGDMQLWDAPSWRGLTPEWVLLKLMGQRHGRLFKQKDDPVRLRSASVGTTIKMSLRTALHTKMLSMHHSLLQERREWPKLEIMFQQKQPSTRPLVAEGGHQRLSAHLRSSRFLLLRSEWILLYHISCRVGH